MGHINAKSPDLLNKTDGNGMRFVGGVSDCEVCAIWKNTQLAHPKKVNLNVSKPFGLVYTDLMGPTSHAAVGGFENVSKITDEYTKWTQVFIHTKREGSRRQVPAIYT